MERSRHHTGWAGALATAAELSRRGYDAAITLGNTPSLDLICSSPSGESFTVQVKSLSAPNWVLISRHLLEQDPRPAFFFVIVLVPKSDDRPFEFFVLTHEEAHRRYGNQRKVRGDGTPRLGGEGLTWGDVKPHLSRWDKLPK
jgi:hypothetical protein